MPGIEGPNTSGNALCADRCQNRRSAARRAPARPLLQNHVHGFAVGTGTTLAKAMQDGFKDIADICFEFVLLGDIESHFLKFH